MPEPAIPGAEDPPRRRTRLSDLPPLQVVLAAPRGFCAGVRRAIAAVEDALALHGPPVYVRRPIVHNVAVMRELEARGAIFVEELHQVPRGAAVVLSAHGVSPAIAGEATRSGFTVYDAVCPLVAKVHRQVQRYHSAGRHVLLIGHAGHPEIEATLGHLPAGAATLVRGEDDVAGLPFRRTNRLAYAVQTTFSVADAAGIIARLQARFDDLAAPAASDICYATTNRQQALGQLSATADAVIVVGEHFSSNATRLAELAARDCSFVQLAADASQLDWAALPSGGGTVAVTAAASTPESSVAGIVQLLGTRYRITVREVAAATETAQFSRVRVPEQLAL